MRFHNENSNTSTMKTKLIALIPLFSSLLFAAPPMVKVAWDDPGPEERAIISHYRLHLGTVSGDYGAKKDLPSSSNGSFAGVYEDLVIGTTYFAAVTAVGTNGLESDY